MGVYLSQKLSENREAEITNPTITNFYIYPLGDFK